MKDRSNSLFALLLILVGIIWLLKNLGITDVNLLQYWPVLIIVWGLQALLSGSRNLGAIGLSIFVIIIGTVLLAGNLGFTTITIGDIVTYIFPVFIILIGLSLFSGRTNLGKSTTAFMGGVERGKNASWTLESESYFAFMGGIELDLRHAVIHEGETLLDLTAVMGGIEIRVPADLPVVADGFAILGGVEFFGKGGGGLVGSMRNEQGTTDGKNKVVKIQARAIMGGIDVKRV